MVSNHDLVIIDPLNSSNNVAKSTLKFTEIKVYIEI